MVIVIVRKNYGIDRRQRIKVHGRGYPSFRSSEPYRRRAFAPDRVRHDVETAYLDQETGVSNPGKGEQIGSCPRNDVRRSHSREYTGVWVWATRIPPALDQRPFQKIKKSVHLR